MNSLCKLAINIAARNRRRLLRQVVSKQQSRWTSTIENPPGMKPAPQFSIPHGIFGQATCHTHPHLIQPGHLTCGISQIEFRERRETLVNKLAAEFENMHKSHIIVIPAACKQYMSDKIPYVFRQNSDFFYLTGCLEPSAILVMVKPAQTDSFKSVLFVHEKDVHAELWEGPRTGSSAAAGLFAVDEARPVENFAGFISKITASSKPAVVWYHGDSPANPDIHSTIQSAAKAAQATVADPQRALHFMRVHKSPAEIELMKETCYIGAHAMNMAMATTKPGVTEHQVNAVLDYSCRQSGAEHLAFPPVVAGGARATHIHYVANNQVLNDGDMLLVDSDSSS
ncbi:xaa-Pro aminopeptidase 3-like [Ostrinia furnacalis]|uniref:xaa-Pro aminopeptidase 3-like n=1 Tax=Ostrinia furnacalis TaxID=93504 RepID=UPI001039502E|nr:xaa-Pro aminopeptidase 3-like [Ostrinia furnacalis]